MSVRRMTDEEIECSRLGADAKAYLAGTLDDAEARARISRLMPFLEDLPNVHALPDLDVGRFLKRSEEVANIFESASRRIPEPTKTTRKVVPTEEDFEWVRTVFSVVLGKCDDGWTCDRVKEELYLMDMPFDPRLADMPPDVLAELHASFRKVERIIRKRKGRYRFYDSVLDALDGLPALFFSVLIFGLIALSIYLADEVCGWIPVLCTIAGIIALLVAISVAREIAREGKRSFASAMFFVLIRPIVYLYRAVRSALRKIDESMMADSSRPQGKGSDHDTAAR